MRLAAVLFPGLPLLTAFVMAPGSLWKDKPDSYVQVGQQIPPFTVTNTERKQVKITDLRGEIVLVNFWATWCGPCLAEMPRLEKEIWQKYKGDKFTILAIDREESEQQITTFRNQHDFTFPMGFDPNRDIYKLFADSGIPRNYVVGANGDILFESVGYSAEEFDRMKKVIQRELANLKKASQ